MITAEDTEHAETGLKKNLCALRDLRGNNCLEVSLPNQAS